MMAMYYFSCPIKKDMNDKDQTSEEEGEKKIMTALMCSNIWAEKRKEMWKTKILS